jgi:competence protein CoiA
MQLYAFDENQMIISAAHAQKKHNYFCAECGNLVHLRGGFHRKVHFYHLHTVSKCRQNGKSLPHLQAQSHLLALLPLGECQLERPFPTIRRIADVVWETKKIVFEIQCSPISSQEVAARNKDYHSLDYRVVWILHDQQFNRPQLSAAEFFLQQSTHYFTDMDADGTGYFYDQPSITCKGWRRERLPRLPVDLSSPFFMESFPTSSCLLKNRTHQWLLRFSGDLVERYDEFKDELREMETKYLPAPMSGTDFCVKVFKQFIVNPYNALFRYFLEKACR